MRTGILGGTFDPIHIAHLHVAEVALDQLALDRVLLIPAKDPWQKPDHGLTAVHHRVAMAHLAAAGVPGVSVDEREVNRDGPTYTIDTLASFPEDEELVLILGADTASGIRTWHRWETVVGRVTMAIAPRPVTTPEDVHAVLDEVVWLEMEALAISSTEIRRRAEAGRPYRFLVPERVWRYITENDLYDLHPAADTMNVTSHQEDIP